MPYTYILYSEKCNRFYIGYSDDPLLRLETRHNAGTVKATRNCRPYKLMKMKAFDTELQAMQEERRIKKMKSAIYIKSLIIGDW